MSTEDAIERIHRAGYGIRIDLWAESTDYAVVLWRDGKPVGSAHGIDLAGALVEAEERAKVDASA